MKKAAADNRKAGFEIAVEQTYEAGLVLRGDEIKSIRAGRVQLTGAYVKLLHPKGRAGIPEPVVVGMHLSAAGDAERSRRLLLHKKEIVEIAQALQAKGKTAVPLKLYLHHGWAKVLIGVGSGRRSYDKRQVIKQRDTDRQVRRDLKGLS